MGIRVLDLAIVVSSLLGCGGRYLEVSGDDDSASMAGGGSFSPSGGGFQSPGKPSGGTTMPPQVGSGGGGSTAPSGGPTAKCGPILPKTRDQYHPPASCDFVESEVVGLAPNAAVLNELLIGQWLLCSASFFHTQDDVGFEVTPDFRWHKLVLDGAGGLVPDTSPESSGTVEELDNGGYMQLNLASALGTYVSLPAFTRVPLKMRLEQLDPQLGEYVKNDESGLCVDGAPAPPNGPYTTPTSCTAATIPMLLPNSVQQAQRALIGRWQTCGGSIFYPGDDVGFELYADGSFRKLYTDSSGAVYAGHGFDREGTYEVLHHGTVQLNLNVHGSGTLILLPEFRDEPRSIELNNGGMYRARYVYLGNADD
jgi:hypothetical protein